MKELDALIAQSLPQVIEWRHDLHAHPQLSYKETYACQLVQRELGAAGVEHSAPLAETGVVGWIVPHDAAAAGRKAIALRADMDALPLAERSGKPYASTFPGMMHACGHDGHTAAVLGAAKVLADCRDALPRPVKLFFQPAEEGGGGAKRLIDAGAMTAAVGGCDVGAVFAVHGYPFLPVGKLGLRPGPMMARADAFQITILGRGGHGARPEHTRDAIAAAAYVVTALQTVISRNIAAVEPAVVGVGSIHAGTASNIIPDRAELTGTIRTFSDDTAKLIWTRIEQIATGVAGALGCEAKVNFTAGYPVTVNDPAMVEYFKSAAAWLGPDAVETLEPTMGAEDFSYYGRVAPSCIARLGCRPPDADDYPNLHSPQFDFNDDALAVAIRVFCELALGSGGLDID